MYRSELIDDLISVVHEKNVLARDVRVGISWTAVIGKYCGLAKTYANSIARDAYTRNMGSLAEKNTFELAGYLRSWNLIEASIGLAAINSMIPSKGKTGINALDIIAERGKNKKITFVGKFPHIEKVREKAKEVVILELDQSLLDPARGILPATAAEYLLPNSDIVAITGSAIVNKSMERLLKLCKSGNAYVVVLGPSTPMCDVLFDYGANMLAGVEVTNYESLLKKISQGGGMLSQQCLKMNLRSE